jgi:hypothetical protein
MVGPSTSGPRRATKELARQDAIHAGFGYRDVESGLAEIDPSVRIEIADGEAEATKSDLIEGDALAVLVVHGREADDFARRRRAACIDTAEARRWQAIGQEIARLRAEASGATVVCQSVSGRLPAP